TDASFRLKKSSAESDNPEPAMEPHFDLEAEAKFELYAAHGRGVVCGAEPCVLWQLFARVDGAARVKFGVLQRHARRVIERGRRADTGDLHRVQSVVDIRA